MKLEFDRQIRLRDFGLLAQQKLQQARVLVVGAGGLGCPVLLYLAASGIGCLGVADGDRIEMSNLHRQVLFGKDDIGKNKALTAAAQLQHLHPGTEILAHPFHITTENAPGLLDAYDLIVDGTDNFQTRYLLNDITVLLNKPLIQGSVFEYEGQVAVYNHPDEQGIQAQYRHLFPKPPQRNEVPGCNEAGVLGVLTGVIGTLMAAEVIKVVAQTGKSLSNHILTLNVRNNTQSAIRILQKQENMMVQGMPQSLDAFKTWDYTSLCNRIETCEILPHQLETMMMSRIVRLIDIREHHEIPEMLRLKVEKIPLSEWRESLFRDQSNQVLVLICQTGFRSLEAAKEFRQLHPGMEVWSLSGGVVLWNRIHFSSGKEIRYA